MRDVEFQWIGGAKLSVRNGMRGATGNIYCGLHEFADMAFVLHLLRPGDLFVDVGANIGSYTVLASKVCGADTIAVEPDPGTTEALERNIAINEIRDRVETVEAALAANSGTTRFTIGLDTVNRVATSGDHQTREVRTARLDDVLDGKSPTLIKLDVEGFEAEVLLGAAATLANPSLLAIETECDSPDVVSKLLAAGFEHVYYDPFSRRLSSAPVYANNNALFVKDRSACETRLTKAVQHCVLGIRF